MQPEKPSETPTRPAPVQAPPNTPLTIQKPATKNRPWLVITVIILLVVLVALTAYTAFKPAKQTVNDTAKTVTTKTTTERPQATNVQGMQLDTGKNYGDKYANGILPVGDNQYSTTAAEKGKVYLCHANFVPASQAGAQVRGPWFIGTTQWGTNKKAHVQGSVQWDEHMSNTVSGATRTISTNDLPDHVTGTFPVGTADPAYKYDRNPNTISSQSLTYTLAANPAYGAPQCMDGEVGIMLTGAALFNAFDAGGRDAGAWEVQDTCSGHPQGSGEYHYHTLSSCIKDVSVGTIIGFALDGFPITGPKVGTDNYLATADLDECHGLTSQIILEGKKVTSYHYVMTQDFPYSAGCFRSTASRSPALHTSGGRP
jgi:hypothetical protein